MTIGEQVLKQRKKIGLTQFQLATKAKISLDTLSRIERDKDSNPTIYVIKQLNRVLSLTIKL